MEEKTDLEIFDAALADANDGLSAEELGVIFAATPWQDPDAGATSRPILDEDGFEVMTVGSDEMNYKNFQILQASCWAKFNTNPFVYTNITDSIGRMTGLGFFQSCSIPKLETLMEDVWEDDRNNLVINFPKYVARSEVQGELFLALTLHKSGFVEVDFVSPTTIKGFKDNSGVLTHPQKPSMPLLYRVEVKDEKGGVETKYIPSINLAYFPDLWAQTKRLDEYKSNVKSTDIVGAATGKEYSKLNNRKTFIIAFDKGFVTKRNVGRVKTVLEWITHYTNIKKWELDHKKSSGSYLWAITMEDKQTLRMWLSMTDEQREATGLKAKKTPGGTLILPPGMSITCHNPKLASISNQDDDILRMVSSGLNSPEDVMTGSSSGTTFGGAKMSRGPVADRAADDICDLERFLVYTFWKAIFFLNSQATGLALTYKVNKAYKFENKEPKFKKVTAKAHKLIEIDFPVSEMGDLESKARALLGVKHGPISETLGIPAEEVAKKLGFPSYRRNRLSYETEQENYPDLPNSLILESMQSQAGEAGLETNDAGMEDNNSEENTNED